MAQISTRKRGNTWEYSFEVAPVNGKRKRKSKGGFRTKKECLEAGTKAKAEYDNKGYINEPKKILINDYLYYWYENEVKINKKYIIYRKMCYILNILYKALFSRVFV